MNRNIRTLIYILCVFFISQSIIYSASKKSKESTVERIIRVVKPLKEKIGKRLPIYMACIHTIRGDDKSIERQVKALAKRGIASFSSWKPGKNQQKSLEHSLKIAAIQKKLGVPVNISASMCVYYCCNGKKETAHIDDKGTPFFNESIEKWMGGPASKLGCPFTFKVRYPEIQKQLSFFCEGFKKKGIDIDFVWTDWEVDGPIEWNGSWDAAKKCVVCQKNIKDLNNFKTFQKVYRKERSRYERECYAKIVRSYFPDILVGNYAVYPNDGWRYWYDWFEKVPDNLNQYGMKLEHKFPVRPWVDEFNPSNYTMAMPVVYAWRPIYDYYNWKNTDYRWFYSLLRVASNAGKHTPGDVPLIPFVNRASLAKGVELLSEEKYTELLWHMLLRGHDSFFVFCGYNNIETELAPVHKVWSESLKVQEFISHGKPMLFDIPEEPGTVISALKHGKQLLVRRTDFTKNSGPVIIKIKGKNISIIKKSGQNQILTLP